MSDVIKDGTGTNNLAKVDSNNRLTTLAVTVEAEQNAAHVGRAFILHARTHTSVASSGGLLYFKNTSDDREFHVTRIYIDAHALSASLIITQFINPTAVSGTDVSSTGIVQKNFSSTVSADGQLIISDASADLTFTGGTEYHAFNIDSKDSRVRDMRLSNVIGPGDTFGLGFETYTGNAVDAEIISFSINLVDESANGTTGI